MKKYTSYLLALSFLGVMLLPLSTSAFSLKSTVSNIKVEDREDDELRIGVNASVNGGIGDRVRAEAKAEAEVRAQAKADDKDSKKNEQNNEKVNKKENKNLKENKGFWMSWFAKFFAQTNLDIKSAIITKNNATSTTVGWVTNQETKGKVYFSTDANLTASSTAGLSFVEDSNFSIDHKTTLVNLLPGTKYYYFIEYQNRAGEIVKSEVFSFKTKALVVAPALTPKILFHTVIKIDSDTAQIVWLTNESSNSKVWVSTIAGVNTLANPMKSSGSMSIFHNLDISGLATSTTYFYVVGSTDASGNTVLSTENSFVTLAQ